MINFDPQEWAARLASVRWFSAIGDSSPALGSGFAAQRVASVDEASFLLGSSDWEAVTADAAGRLTEWLSSSCKDDFQRWNVIAREVKALFDGSVIAGARTAVVELSIDPVLVVCSTWDVLHAVMEATYADCRPPRFFMRLLAVYEAGHVPCSWSGTWPEGTLLYR